MSDGLQRQVQYFERSVLALDPTKKAPNNVSVLPLGKTFLDRFYPNYPLGISNEQPSNDPKGVQVPLTGKFIGGLFLKYWEEHGGIAAQGAPLTNEFDEVSRIDGEIYKVQYFEKAVFELHPKNKPPYNVLLTPLGKLEYQEKYITPHLGILEDFALWLGNALRSDLAKNLGVPILFTLLAATLEVLSNLMEGIARGSDKYKIWKVVATPNNQMKHVSEDHQSVVDVLNSRDVVAIDHMFSFSTAQMSFLGLELAISALAVDIVVLINRVSNAQVLGGVFLTHFLLMVFILLLVSLCRSAHPGHKADNVLGAIAILAGFFSMMFAFIVL
jgi:hypothetical protein